MSCKTVLCFVINNEKSKSNLASFTFFFLNFGKRGIMGIVNSFVNQIGREIGRDTYRSVTSNNKGRNNVSTAQSSDQLLQDVKFFQLSGDDEATLLLITNLVEKSENSDPEDFEWQELFKELDNKIDFCKDNLDTAYHPKLAILDQLNADNFQKIKKEHIDYIKRVIVVLENNDKILEQKNITTAKLLSLIGLRPYYMDKKVVYSILNIILLIILGNIFYLGYLAYSEPILNGGNAPVSTQEQIAKVSRMGVTLMVCNSLLYVFFLVFAFRKVRKYEHTTKENKKSIAQFRKYLLELQG